MGSSDLRIVKEHEQPEDHVERLAEADPERARCMLVIKKAPLIYVFRQDTFRKKEDCHSRRRHVQSGISLQCPIHLSL